MPMAPKIRLVDGHRHKMTLTGSDIPIASGTEVGLGRLIGLDATDLDRQAHRVEFVLWAHLSQPNKAQMTRPRQVMSAATTMT